MNIYQIIAKFKHEETPTPELLLIMEGMAFDRLEEQIAEFWQ